MPNIYLQENTENEPWYLDHILSYQMESGALHIASHPSHNGNPHVAVLHDVLLLDECVLFWEKNCVELPGHCD